MKQIESIILKKQALEQLRLTQAKITADHPELLETLRRKITGHTEEDIPIDKKKNLKTIAKYLEFLQAPSKDFKSELKKALQENPV